MSRMYTKHIKQILVLVCCVTLVFSGAVASAPCVYGDATQKIAKELEESVQTDAQVETAAQKRAAKKAKKAKKKAATKKNQQKIVRFAKRQLGKRYKYGAMGPKSFDCIGLVYYVFKNAGAKLKSSMTYDKVCHMKTRYGKNIVSHKAKKAKAGDIVIFYSGNHVKHACIAIGNGKCVNASKRGVVVKKIPSYAGCKIGVIRLVK